MNKEYMVPLVFIVIGLVGIMAVTVYYITPKYSITTVPGSTDSIFSNVSVYMHHSEGKYTGPIMLFALNRSPLSIEAKLRLEALGVDYWWVDMDTLSEDDIGVIVSETTIVCKPNSTIPVIVANDMCLSDFPEDYALYDGIRDAVQ